MSDMSPTTIQTEIASIRPDGDGVVRLDLVASDGRLLPAFTAGAHIDIYLPNGIVRQYSLCGDPANRQHYRLAIRRDDAGRGGSIAMHALDRGRELRVGLPRNHFPLDETAPYSLLLAGGIGITPLVAMAHRLKGLEASFDLHYRASSDQPALAGEIEATPWARHAHFHFGRDRSNFSLAEIIGGSRAGAHIYVCGPKGFLDAAHAAAARLPPGTLHTESFMPTAPAHGDAFLVQTASDGRWHEVPAHRTILDVLTQANYVVPTSCEQGICGTCRTAVLDGVPDHRDVCLSDAERASGRFITPCCSRAQTSRLVLEL